MLGIEQKGKCTRNLKVHVKMHITKKPCNYFKFLYQVKLTFSVCIVAQQVKPSSAMPAFHISAGSNPVPCYRAGENSRRWPSTWTPATHMGVSGGILGSWFGLGLAPSYCSHLESEYCTEDLSL